MNVDYSNPPSAQYSIGEKSNSKFITSLLHNERHIFATGTCNLKSQNEIHIVEFLETEQKITLLNVIQHQGMIDKIISDPLNITQFYVIYSQVQNEQCQKKLTLINSGHLQAERTQNSILFDLGIQRKLQNVIPHQKEPKVFLCDDKTINLYDLNKQSFQSLTTETEFNYSLCEMDPYHENLFSRVQDSKNIHIHDIRDKKIPYIIDGAHNLRILDMDFNPNKQYYFLTAGEDCSVKIWDLRKGQYPMKSISDLSNSPLSAKFNKFHDQLIVMSFDDGTITLYRATSVSSVPLISQMNYHASSKDEDKVVRTYDDHEDSIFQVAWSNATAWVFASVAYNSNIIVNMVPMAEKYKILL